MFHLVTKDECRMVVINWKLVHSLSYLAVYLFALEPSYIHPDEHFQSLEVLTNKFYGYSTNLPWEFQETPSRSLAVLYLVYGPLLWVTKTVGFSPLHLLYLARIQLASSFFLVVQVAVRILCDTNQEQTKALFFIYTSYITWTYQSHTFSNSIETQLLLVALSLVQFVKRARTAKGRAPLYRVQVILGAVVAIGIFNRITFVAFLLLPSLLLLSHYKKYPLAGLFAFSSLVFTSFLLILSDTFLLNSTDYVITPWNNLMYNSKIENLAEHGLHHRYTHLLINIPQILGPAIIPFFFRNHYKTSIAYLSILSGLIFLSLIPHQELRFLIPLVPLFCICFDFTNFERHVSIDRLMKIWCVFNIFMGILMGSLHQRGVLEGLDHLRRIGYSGPQIWWKTYSPPAYLLGSKDLVISVHTAVHGEENQMIDLMGDDVQVLINTVRILNNTLLITPRSSVPLLESVNKTLSYERVWSSEFHLDLDHFDLSDIRTFYPGIDIYSVNLI